MRPLESLPSPRQRRCLVAWWGAFERGGETIGDLRALHVIARLLREEGFKVVIATEVVYRELLEFECAHWVTVDPTSVDILAFVCGPIPGDSPSFRALHERFACAASIAIGVSVLPALAPGAWSPFGHVIARDGGSAPVFGDLAKFRYRAPKCAVPVRRIGICLRGAQREYGANESLHEKARQVVEAVLEMVGGEVVELDTRLQGNAEAADVIEAEFESVDLVVTTRMHGALLGIAKGKPTLAIDQIRNGAKVSAVVGQIGWPAVISADADLQRVRELVNLIVTAPIVDRLVAAQHAMTKLHIEACLEICSEVRKVLRKLDGT